MSLKPEVIAWAKSYYYTGIGLEAKDPLLNYDDEEIGNAYNKLFIEPMLKLLDLKNWQDFAKDPNARDIYKELLRQLPQANYVLRELCEYGCLTTTDVTTLVNSFKEGKRELVYVVNNNNKDFKVFFKNQTIVGTYPSEVHLVNLGDAKHLRGNGDIIPNLAKKDPFYLSDFAIRALRTAVQHKCIDERELRTTVKLVPSGNGFVTKSVNALYEQLPSYAVRSLLSHIPEALVKEYDGNVYLAALEFVKESSAHKHCLDELQLICSQASAAKREVNESDVLTYLNERYGIEAESLDEVVRPTSKMMFTSAYLLDTDSKGMTAEEFIDYVNSDQGDASGTLDEIIEAYCAEEKVSLDCSIEQLIDSINGSDVTPKSLADKLIELKMSNSSVKDFGETTVDELIAGVPHKTVNLVDKAWDVINSNVNISEDVKKGIQAALFNSVPLELPDFADMIMQIQMPDNLRSDLISASITGQPYELPDPTDDDIETQLVRKGIPRAVIHEILESGKLPEPDIKQVLLSVGYSGKLVDAILSKEVVPTYEVPLLAEQSKAVTETLSTPEVVNPLPNDIGYSICNSLLTSLRHLMTTNDSQDLRNDVLPIFYSFSRILMLKKGDEQDAMEYLESKIESCKPYIGEIIENSLAPYRKEMSKENE